MLTIKRILLVMLSFLGMMASLRLEAQPARPDLRAQLQKIIETYKGHVALAAKNFDSGEEIEIQATEKVQTASTIKFPILVEVFYQVKEGRLNWEDLILVGRDNKVQGSGILQDLSSDLILSLKDAVTLMIVLSDNTATNLVIDKVGLDAVNTRMKKLGLENTRLFKKVFLPPERPSEEQKKFGLGVTTAAEMLRLLEMLYRGELVDRASSEAMIAILKKQRDRDQIPRFISFNEPAGTSNGVTVANKTGALDRVRNDVGVVFAKNATFAFSLFAWDSPDVRWTADNSAALTLARLSKTLFDAFSLHPRPAEP